MARKSWSNLLLLVAAVNLALAVIPGNPFRLFDWIAFPACVMFGAYLRRRMI